MHTNGLNLYKKRIGLALGSGGARGLCHIEFCRALDELDVKPTIIAGASIGAIVGAFYAAGMSGARMAELSSEISLFDYGKMMDFSILSHTGLVKGKKVTDFLSDHLPAKTFEELSIPLKIVTTNFWTRKEIVFETGELIPALRASISIPGLFKPVRMGGMILIDGGAANPVPMSSIREECDILIAIDVSGTSVPSRQDRVPTMFESVMVTFQILETAFIENQLKIYQPEVIVKPLLKNVQLLDFHRDKKIRKSVQDDVRRFKRELENLLVEDSVPPQKGKRRFLFRNKK